MNITEFKTKNTELLKEIKERLDYNSNRGGFGFSIDGELLKELVEALENAE